VAPVWNVVAEPIEHWEFAIASDSDNYDRRSKVSVEGLRQRLSYLPHDELESKQFDWEWELTPRHRAGGASGQPPCPPMRLVFGGVCGVQGGGDGF
jgi:hypothetical protein